jgi:hypothetical protein
MTYRFEKKHRVTGTLVSKSGKILIPRKISDIFPVLVGCRLFRKANTATRAINALNSKGLSDNFG